MARPRKGQPLLRDFIAEYFKDRPNKDVKLVHLVNAGVRRGLSKDTSYYRELINKLIGQEMPIVISTDGARFQLVVSEEEDVPDDQELSKEKEPKESEEDSGRPVDPNEEVILRWYLMDLATVAILDGRPSYQNLLDVAKEVHRDKRNNPGSVARWAKMTNDERLLYIQEIAETLRERFDEYNSHSYSKMLNYTKRRK